MERKRKLVFVVCLSSAYILSFILMTVGYFTPMWAVYIKSDKIPCDWAGLISGWCRFHYWDLVTHEYYLMRSVFYLETTAMVGLYVNTGLLIVGILFRLLEDQIFIAFLSISFGVLYPISGVLALSGCILIEANFGDNTGFSCILCSIAGILMILFYIGLRIYDHMYLTNRDQKFKIYNSEKTDSVP